MTLGAAFYLLVAVALVLRALFLAGSEWQARLRAFQGSNPEPFDAFPTAVTTLGMLILRTAAAATWPIAALPYAGHRLRQRDEERSKALPPARIVK